MTRMKSPRVLLVGVLAVAIAACAATPPSTGPQAPTSLEGSSWRLVQLQMSNDTTRAAIERSRYTIGFGANGVLNVRFDCNRGRGSWQSSGPGSLEFGPL